MAAPLQSPSVSHILFHEAPPEKPSKETAIRSIVEDVMYNHIHKIPMTRGQLIQHFERIGELLNE